MIYDLDVPSVTLAPDGSSAALLRLITALETRDMAKTLLRIAGQVQQSARTSWISEIQAYPEAVAIVVHQRGEGAVPSGQAAIIPYRDVSAAYREEAMPVTISFVRERDIEASLPWTEEEDLLYPQASAAIHALRDLLLPDHSQRGKTNSKDLKIPTKTASRPDGTLSRRSSMDDTYITFDADLNGNHGASPRETPVPLALGDFDGLTLVLLDSETADYVVQALGDLCEP